MFIDRRVYMKRFKFILLLFLFIPFIVKGESVGINDTDINSISFGDDWAIVTRDNYKEVLAAIRNDRERAAWWWHLYGCLYPKVTVRLP